MLIQALYWLAILLGADVLLKLLPLSHVLNGIAAACFMCVHMKYLAQLSDTGNRALILSVFGAIVGLFGGLTPILWGWILKGSGAAGGAMNLSAFTCFFVLMALTFALLQISIRRFQLSEDQQPIVFNPSALLRPNRIFTALGQLYVDSKKSNIRQNNFMTNNKILKTGLSLLALATSLIPIEAIAAIESLLKN